MNAATPDGQTALLMAVEQEDLELAKKLVEKGADVNYRDPKTGINAMLLATSLGDLDMAKFLFFLQGKNQ